jgi:hypothetical protein
VSPRAGSAPEIALRPSSPVVAGAPHRAAKSLWPWVLALTTLVLAAALLALFAFAS